MLDSNLGARMDPRRVSLLIAALLAFAHPIRAQEGETYSTFYTAIERPGCGYGNPWDWAGDSYTNEARVSGQVLTTAMSNNFYRDGKGCGACFEVCCLAGDQGWGGGSSACTGKCVTVTVTDLCPYAGNERWCDNSHYHFDMSPQAFDHIVKSQKSGWVKSSFRRVDCRPAKDGSPLDIHVQAREGSGEYWAEFFFLYVGGRGTTAGVQVSDDGGRSWKECDFDYGAMWAHHGKLENSPLSFQLTTENGQRVTMINTIPGGWYGGSRAYSSGVQFGSGGGSQGFQTNRGRAPARRPTPRPRPRPKPRGMRKGMRRRGMKGMHCRKGMRCKGMHRRPKRH